MTRYSRKPLANSTRLHCMVLSSCWWVNNKLLSIQYSFSGPEYRVNCSKSFSFRNRGLISRHSKYSWKIFSTGRRSSTRFNSVLSSSTLLSNDRLLVLFFGLFSGDVDVCCADFKSGTKRRLLDISASLTSYVLLSVHKTIFSDRPPLKESTWPCWIWLKTSSFSSSSL